MREKDEKIENILLKAFELLSLSLTQEESIKNIEKMLEEQGQMIGNLRQQMDLYNKKIEKIMDDIIKIKTQQN